MYFFIVDLRIDPTNPNKLVPSKQLCFVTEPEEKRKIIGDVFMHVSENFLPIIYVKHKSKKCIILSPSSSD